MEERRGPVRVMLALLLAVLLSTSLVPAQLATHENSMSVAENHHADWYSTDLDGVESTPPATSHRWVGSSPPAQPFALLPPENATPAPAVAVERHNDGAPVPVAHQSRPAQGRAPPSQQTDR
jgi:hypothetical protein